MRYRINSNDSPEKKYKSSISNLLLIVVFSAINIGLLLTNADRYFLFSAFIPYFMVDYAMYLCGYYPLEYYGDLEGIEFFDKSVLIITVIIAAIIIAVYLLCWLLAKKRKVGALITALVFFVIDTVAMLFINGISGSSALDIVFHGWIIVAIIIAIVKCVKIKKAEAEGVPEATEVIDSAEQVTAINGYSTPIRRAEDEKSRVLVEAEASGMHIVYRRIKGTNELLINDYVYDVYDAKLETGHTLSAYYNGHKVEAIFDGSTSVKILVDSQEVAKKLRLF